MNLKELKEQLKKAKVTQEKYAYILTENFYLTSNKSDELLNQHTDGSKEIINISSHGFIVITPYAKGLYTDKFLNEIAKTGIELIKLDFWGNPVWGFYPASRTLANLVKAQILFTTEKYNDLRAQLIVELVKSKVESEGLKNTKIPILNKDIEKWIQTGMMMYEGEKASQYWEKFKNQNDILEDFSRATEKTKGKNYKAQDHVNALLNLGYGILAHKITFKIYEMGLDPTIGFYHFIKAKGQRYSLTWDLIEPVRYIIDNVLLKYINQIQTEDFEQTVEDKVKYLTLRDIQHKAGTKPFKLKYEHDNPYKKWVNIFTKELHDTNITFWIDKYKEALFTVMETEKMNPEEKRMAGINQTKYNIKKFTDKFKKAKIPKGEPIIENLEVISGDIETPQKEPEQEKDKDIAV